MKTPHIDVDDYLAWFFVETVHGNMLEFVLKNAEERRGTDYETMLWELLKKEFADQSETRMVEYTGYGNISYLVAAPSPEALQSALRRCEQVVKCWKSSNNINRMKRQ